MLSLGYEFHKKMNKFWMYYGGDIFIDYHKIYYKEIDDIDQITFTTNSEKMEVGGQFLIGFKYFLTQNIALSTEGVFKVAYNSLDINSKAEPFGSMSARHRYEWKTAFNPFYVINLSYHF